MSPGARASGSKGEVERRKGEEIKDKLEDKGEDAGTRKDKPEGKTREKALVNEKRKERQRGKHW